MLSNLRTLTEPFSLFPWYWRAPASSHVRAGEGLPRPRVARAQETFQSFLSQLHSLNEHLLTLLVSLWRSGQAALNCAHRTSTFLFLGRAPMLVYVRPSNEFIDGPSKLARCPPGMGAD